MTEVDLDMVAAAKSDERDQLIAELARRPDEILPIATNALSHPPKSRWGVAVRVIRKVGYPRNSSAIPALVNHLGDPNWVGWSEAMLTLEDIGAESVVPYLIQVLWDKGRTNRYWASDVEGICAMLCQVKTEFAHACGPVIAHLLGPTSKEFGVDASWLLDVLEKIGPDSAQYSLPVLIDFMTQYATADENAQTHRLITSFERESLKVYDRVLDSSLFPHQ